MSKSWELISNVSKEYEWEKWKDEIPYLQFQNDWQVRAVPPFGGAIIRYNIKKDNSFVSIYLDCYDQLGYCGQPYWEIYPYADDVYRCYMNDTKELLKAIKKSLKQQEKNK